MVDLRFPTRGGAALQGQSSRGESIQGYLERKSCCFVPAEVSTCSYEVATSLQHIVSRRIDGIDVLY